MQCLMCVLYNDGATPEPFNRFLGGVEKRKNFGRVMSGFIILNNGMMFNLVVYLLSE